jgi:hypothetical protein
MENERFALQNVAIPLKWQLPVPKCCKLQGKRTEQQIIADPNKTKTEKTSQNNSGSLVFFFGSMLVE